MAALVRVLLLLCRCACGALICRGRCDPLRGLVVLLSCGPGAESGCGICETKAALLRLCARRCRRALWSGCEAPDCGVCAASDATAGVAWVSVDRR